MARKLSLECDLCGAEHKVDYEQSIFDKGYECFLRLSSIDYPTGTILTRLKEWDFICPKCSREIALSLNEKIKSLGDKEGLGSHFLFMMGLSERS